MPEARSQDYFVLLPNPKRVAPVSGQLAPARKPAGTAPAVLHLFGVGIGLVLIRNNFLNHLNSLLKDLLNEARGKFCTINDLNAIQKELK